MKCSKCGTDFFEGIFCPECGTRVVNVDETIETKNNVENNNRQEIEIELAKQKTEQVKLANEKLEKETEIARLSLEKAKLDKEFAEKEKKENEEKRTADIAVHELNSKVEQQRLAHEAEIEIARQKTEQDRLANERLEKEAEIARLNLEKAKLDKEVAEKEKIENEAREKAAREADEKRKEEQSRTFQGVLYESVEKMELARRQYETEEEERKRLKAVDTKAVLCMIFGLATWPLAFILLWPISFVVTIVFGILAIRGRTRKRGFVITGFVSIGIMAIVSVIGIIAAFI